MIIHKYRLAAVVFLLISLPMLGCKTVFPDPAERTRIAESRSTATAKLVQTQTAQSRAKTQTAAPSSTPTPEFILTTSERKQFTVTLRYMNDDIRDAFGAVENLLQDLGYQVQIDSGPSNVGSMSVILYGSPSCLEAIADIQSQLHDMLDISSLDRVRFSSDDLWHEKKALVIQIDSLNFFAG